MTLSLPIYIKINENSLISNYLDDVQTNYIETISHKACSFEKLARNLDIKSDILFVYQETASTMKPP